MKEEAEAPLGDWAKGKRKERPPSAVALRVRAFLATDEVKCGAGVQPLNAGFFALERLRGQTVAKRKAQKRAKARGK